MGGFQRDDVRVSSRPVVEDVERRYDFSGD
jgi:hypothetical protein